MFGEKLGRGVHPYHSAKIWAPWNLEMGDNSCTSESVDCYCVERSVIGKNSTVNQYGFLCSANPDYSTPKMPLVAAPIVIGDNSWITADVFIAPGVTIGEGSVVLAISNVFSDIRPGALR